MQFVFSKLVGLLSMIGTVLGLVVGGALLESNALMAAAFFLLALVSFATFIGFLYHFIMYARYEMPAEHFIEEDETDGR